MLYALIQNNVVITYPLSLTAWRLDNPNISLPQDPTIAQLNEQGIYEVFPSLQPSYDWITETCAEGTPAKTGEEWLQTWVVTQNTPKQIAANEAQARANNKVQASQLLTATDWTTIPDVSDQAVSNPYLENSVAFAAYRSQVRAIAVNPPVTVNSWPVKPEEIWVEVVN